jgi:hypothetical protein
MKLQFRKSFYTRTSYAGKFNTILMGDLIGLQKSSFTHWETLYPGTSYPGNMSPQKTNWNQHFDGIKEIDF